MARRTLTKVISGLLGHGLLACVAGTELWAQAPAAVDADSVAGQKSAIAAMQDSVARQRQSLQKQLGPHETADFFVLPRAEGLGAISIQPATAECPALPGAEVDSLVGQAAGREGLDADLLRRVMKQESGFHPCAVSKKGAMGLMQLMPATAEQFGVQDPFDARQNVNAGAKLLKQLLSRYNGDTTRALAAYNAGPAKVDAASGIPPIPETLDYVKLILSVPSIH